MTSSPRLERGLAAMLDATDRYPDSDTGRAMLVADTRTTLATPVGSVLAALVEAAVTHPHPGGRMPDSPLPLDEAIAAWLAATEETT